MNCKICNEVMSFTKAILITASESSAEVSMICEKCGAEHQLSYVTPHVVNYWDNRKKGRRSMIHPTLSMPHNYELLDVELRMLIHMLKQEHSSWVAMKEAEIVDLCLKRHGGTVAMCLVTALYNA